jgi:dynein regulatory complex protein 1
VQDEAGLLAAESILRALGVTDGMSFDTLMDALSTDSNIEVKAKVGLLQSSNSNAVSV